MQEPRVPSAPLVGALYLVSGAGALVHEVAWTRIGHGLLGGDARAVAVVLVAILGGMGLGGLLAPVASRRWGALSAFVRVEAVGALYALAIPWVAPALDALVGVAFRSVGPGPAFTVTSALVATLLFAPPALAMGAGLPLLAQVRAPAGRTPRDAGALYAVHALGGAAGGVLAAFALLPTLGVGVTVGIASCLQVAVALGASRLPAPAADTTAERRSSGRRPTRAGLPAAAAAILGAALLAGLGTAALQTLWTRLATLAVGPSTEGFALVAAVYVLALAIGAAVAAPLARRARSPAGSYAILMMSACVAVVFGVDTVGAWTRSASEGHFPLALTVPVFVPIALTAAAFPFGVAALQKLGRRRAARDVGWLVAAGATGNILGVWIAAFALVPAMGLAPSLVAAAGALVVATLLAASAGFKGGPGRTPLKPRHAIVLVGLCAAGAGGLFLAPRHFDPEIGTTTTDGRVVFVHHGVDSTVAVHETESDRLLWVDGRVQSRSVADARSQVLSGLIPALLSDAPTEALLIGLGTGTTADAVRAVPGVERIDVAELIDGVRFAAPWFREQNGDVLLDDRVHVQAVAGPLVLRHGQARYGIIVADLATFDPALFHSALFHSALYQPVRERLTRGGVVAVTLRGSDDVQAHADAFAQAFEDTSVWEIEPGSHYLLVGRRGDPPADAPTPAARLRAGTGAPQVRERLERCGVDDVDGLVSRLLATVETGADRDGRLARLTGAEVPSR